VTTKIYGASDDLVEIEGDIHDEVGCYGTDESEHGVLLSFSDGTIIEVKYGKLDLGIWGIKIHRKGDLFESLTECSDEEAEIYSDIANFKDGIKWVIASNCDWTKIK
jgi:hypothetical protein